MRDKPFYLFQCRCQDVCIIKCLKAVYTGRGGDSVRLRSWVRIRTRNAAPEYGMEGEQTGTPQSADHQPQSSAVRAQAGVSLSYGNSVRCPGTYRELFAIHLCFPLDKILSGTRTVIVKEVPMN